MSLPCTFFVFEIQKKGNYTFRMTPWRLLKNLIGISPQCPQGDINLILNLTLKSSLTGGVEISPDIQRFHQRWSKNQSKIAGQIFLFDFLVVLMSGSRESFTPQSAISPNQTHSHSVSLCSNLSSFQDSIFCDAFRRHL